MDDNRPLPPGIEVPEIGMPEIGTGAATPVVSGLHWLRMPLAPPLGSVNVWALDDGASWTVVDTGLRSSSALRAWQEAETGIFAGRSISRAIVTHMHPDHAGMAGWLHGRQGTSLWMTRLEYLTLKMLISDTGEPPQEAIRFYRAAGMDQHWIDSYRLRFGEFGRRLYPLPIQYHGMRDGDRIAIGGREWQVICAGGHSPDHACLWAAEDGLLISGDEVLARISSNISVQPYEPDADPLRDWLAGLTRIRDLVPDDVLVLPAHGPPFRGLHARIGQLIAGHEAGLERLLSALDQPKRACDVFKALFRREIEDDFNRMLAVGEALAHLACLRGRGLAKVDEDGNGVRWWVRS